MARRKWKARIEATLANGDKLARQAVVFAESFEEAWLKAEDEWYDLLARPDIVQELRGLGVTK